MAKQANKATKATKPATKATIAKAISNVVQLRVNTNYVTVGQKALVAMLGAEDRVTKAQQALAFALLAYHQDLVANKDKPASWKDIATSADAKRTFTSALAKVFIQTVKPSTKDKSAQALQDAAEYNRQYANLVNATKLAAALHSYGVTPNQFDTASGVFHLPAVLLLEANQHVIIGKAMDTTAKANNGNVPLDGTSYRVQVGKGSDKEATVRASIAQLHKAAKSRTDHNKAKATMIADANKEGNVASNAATAPTTAPTTTSGTLSPTGTDKRQERDALPLETLLVQAADILSEPSDGVVTLDDLPAKERDALERIVAFYSKVSAATKAMNDAKNAKATADIAQAKAAAPLPRVRTARGK